MPASLPFALVVPCFTLLPSVAASRIPEARSAPLAIEAFAALDDAEESYQFIVGLSERGSDNDVLIGEALRFLQKHARHPKANQVRYRMATALFDEQNFESARTELSRLAKISGFAYASEVMFRLGQCELERGAGAPALTAFESVLAGGSEYLTLPATFLAGEAAFRVEDYAKAEARYSDLLRLGESEYRVDSAFGMCWCAYKRGEFDSAASRITAFLRAHSSDERVDELNFLLGECHLESERNAEALAAYRKVRGGPSADGALRGAGFASAALGQHAEAAAYFKQLLKDHAKSRFVSEAALQAGIQLLRAGDARAGLKALSHKQAPKGPEALYWVARCHTDMGDASKALATLEGALADRSLRQPDSKPLEARLQVARGDALFELGRGSDAAEAYRTAGSDYALHAAAVARLNDGEAAEALRLIAPVAAKVDSEYRIDALLTQAEALFALKRFDEALPSFELVASEADVEDERARSLARSGWCLFQLDRHKEAAARFRKVEQSYADSQFAAESLFMQGRANEESGQKAQAKTAFASYLSKHGEGAHAVEAGLRLARFEPGSAGEQRLEELLRNAPQSELATQARFDLAERQSAEGRHGVATRNYRALLEAAPQDALAGPATYGLAWGLYSQEQYQDAQDTLGTLLARRDVTPELQLVGLELSVYAGRRTGDVDATTKAFEGFATLCKDETRRLRAAKVTAAALRESGALAQAQRMFADLLKDTKQGDVAVSICVERAYLALDQEDPTSAEKQLRVALPYAEEDADLTEAFFFVGEAWFAAGKDEQAIGSYAVAENSPTADVATRALYKGGFSMLRSEQNQAAATCFRTLNERFPTSSFAGEASFLTGEALYRDGSYAQAIEPLSAVVQRHSRHAVLPKALFRLGLAYARTNQWQQAQSHLANLIQRYPDFPSRDEADLWRAHSLAELGNRRAARTAYEGVTDRDDGVLSARAHIGLGKLSKAEGDLKSALSAFLKVSVLYSLEEEVGEALFLAGGVLEEQGKPARAKTQYEELLERAPKCSHAKNARERIAILP
ncbi:MAG: TolA-binding protein [Planctomycetota bacterium]|jgi:TolA-binding protein